MNNINQRFVNQEGKLSTPITMKDDIIVLGSDNKCNLYFIKFHKDKTYNFSILYNTAEVEVIGKSLFIDFGAIKDNILQDADTKNAVFSVPSYIILSFDFNAYHNNPFAKQMVEKGDIVLLSSNGNISDNIDIFGESHFFNDGFVDEASNIISQNLYYQSIASNSFDKFIMPNMNIRISEISGSVILEASKIYKLSYIDNYTIYLRDIYNAPILINLIKYKNLLAGFAYNGAVNTYANPTVVYGGK